MIAIVIIVPVFIKGVATSGTGLTIEIILTAAGLALGLSAAALMRVYRSLQTGRPVTRAGFPYGLVRTIVIAARAAFSYGSVHWFGPSLNHWMLHHHVTSAAITDAVIFMALAMVVTRVVSIGLRAAALRPASARQVALGPTAP